MFRIWGLGLCLCYVSLLEFLTIEYLNIKYAAEIICVFEGYDSSKATTLKQRVTMHYVFLVQRLFLRMNAFRVTVIHFAQMILLC